MQRKVINNAKGRSVKLQLKLCSFRKGTVMKLLNSIITTAHNFAARGACGAGSHKKILYIKPPPEAVILLYIDFSHKKMQFS